MPKLALITDFGSDTPYPALCKQMLKHYNPKMEMVDLSHDVHPFDLNQSSYYLHASWNHFKEGSIFLILTDLFGGNSGELLYCRQQNKHVICPDNGFLTVHFYRHPVEIKKMIPAENMETFQKILERIAEQVQAIREGNEEDLQTADSTDIFIGRKKEAAISQHDMMVNVLMIDRYENIILDLQRDIYDEIAQGRRGFIYLPGAGETEIIKDHYNAVPVREPVCRFNSAGFLEIALNKSNAAGMFGYKSRLNPNNAYDQVKINFQ